MTRKSWILGLSVALMAPSQIPAHAEDNPRDSRFMALDSNADGLLSEAEAGIQGKQKLRLLWHGKDRDDDGYLSPAEYRQFEELVDDYTRPPAPNLPPAWTGS